MDDILITMTGGSSDPWEPTPDPTFVPGGAANPTATPVSKARGAGNVAALTFDDGPNPGETRPLTSSPADQALLRSRMETHIKAIANHMNARYPDEDSPVWAWDVVNEVIADGDTANPHDMRDSRWFQNPG